MKRPHADLIHAWADGSEIQKKIRLIDRQEFYEFEWVDELHPGFYRDCEYRIKPAPKKYRVALFSWGTRSVDNEEVAAISVKLENFIKWLDDWKYYEEESC